MYAEFFINIAPIFVLFVVFLSTYFFITEKICSEVVALSSIGILTFYFGIFFANTSIITGYLFNNTVISIIGILIIGKTISYTGVINKFITFVMKIENPNIISILLLCITYLISGFVNNTPIVIVFVSLLLIITEQVKISNSRIMMPIAFAASLGAMLTVFGSSTNILIQSKLAEMGYNIGIFSFFLPGLFVSFLGLLYVILLTKIIPDKVGNYGANKKQRFSLILNPPKHQKITFCDISRREIKNILYGQNFNENLVLEEVVISNESKIIGCYVADDKVLKELHAVGIAVESREEKILPGAKVLVVHKKELKREIPGTVIIKKNSTYILSRKNTIKTLAIFFGVVLFSTFTNLPLSFNAFFGATLLVITGVINVGQLLKSIDRKVLFMIMYAFAVSQSMEVAGILKYAADFLYATLYNYSEITVVAVLFIVITLLNEIMSNNAVGLVFTPVIVMLGQKIGIDIEVLVWTLIFAANAAFLTPFGYQTNLIVMQHGNYKFIDYIKFGLPLNIIVLIGLLLFLVLFR